MAGRLKKIKDVARAAGVSESTVSRVLSGNTRISEQTREKVMRVVNDMSYKPHAIATSLARNRSNSIGIVIPDCDCEFYSTYFFQEVLRGISAIVSDKGYDLLISAGKPSEYTAIRDLVESRKVDGIILMRSCINDRNVKFLHDNEFPFVLIGSNKEYDDIFTIDNDNFGAAFELTKHLLQQNRRHIAFIGGERSFIYTLERLEGYKHCIESSGLLLDKNHIRLGIGTEKDAYMAMEELLHMESTIDAVIITDDTVCAGIIDNIRENGMRIPDNIAVACFNDSLYNKLSIPPITSISVNSVELGRKAAEIICSVLSGVAVEKKKNKVDFKLLIRGSTLYQTTCSITDKI